MTGFNHVLAGITIAVTVQQPVLAPIAALASHFALDMLPHFGGATWFDTWGKKLLIMASIDAALCTIFIGLGIWLFPDLTGMIIVCAIAALLPDLFWILHYKYGVQHRFFTFHQAIQRFERPWGAYIELLFCGVLLGFLGTRF